jgi:hypothetical protein
LPTALATEVSGETCGATAETTIEPSSVNPPSVIYGDDHRRPGGSFGLQPVPIAAFGPAPVEAQDRISRDWITGVARLDPLHAPAGVALHRWREFVRDCKHFVDSPENWAERAAELGWDAVSLFGCYPVRPLDHLGSAGLLWRLGGGKITALHKDWAAFEIDGAQRTYHRRPAAVRSVLPWSLR